MPELFAGFDREDQQGGDPFAGFDRTDVEVPKEVSSIVEQPWQPEATADFTPFEVTAMPAMERAKEMPRAIGEVGAHVIGGAAMWVPSMIAKFGQVGLHNMTNAIAQDVIDGKMPGGSTPEQVTAAKKVLKSPGKIQELGEESEALLSSYFGAMPDVETESGKRILNVVGQAMHTLTTPARKLATVIPDEYPNLKDFVQFLGEAGTFAATGKVGKSINRKIKAIDKNVKEGKFDAADAKVKDVMAKFDEKAAVPMKPESIQGEFAYDISTPKLRQEHIDRWFGETLASRTQEKINAIQQRELGTQPKPKRVLPDPPKKVPEPLPELDLSTAKGRQQAIDRAAGTTPEMKHQMQIDAIKELGTEVPPKLAGERAYEGQTGERIVPPEAQRIMDAAERTAMKRRLSIKEEPVYEALFDKQKKVLDPIIEKVQDAIVKGKEIPEAAQRILDLAKPKAKKRALELAVKKAHDFKKAERLEQTIGERIEPLAKSSVAPRRGDLIPEAQRIQDAAMQTLRKRLLKTMSDQRGAITLEKLTPAERATISRMIKEASVAGIEVRKYLQKQGIERREAKSIAKLAKEMEEIQIKNPLKLEEGEARVNVSRKANPAIAVGEGMLKELKALERTTTPGIIKGFTTAPQKFAKLGGSIKGLHTKYKVANKARFEDTKIVEGQLKDLSKEFSNKKLRQEAGGKGLARTPNGRDAMEKMGVPVKEGPIKYDALLERLEPMFESLYDRVNEMRVAIGKKPLAKMDNYLPFFAQEHYFDTLNTLFKGKKEAPGKPNMVLDAAEAIQHRHKPGTVEATNFAHIKRGKLREGTHLELDPLQLYAKYSNTALNHIHMSPINAFVKELVTKPLKDPETGKNYQLSNSNREVADFLGQWSNSIAGVENINAPRFLSKAAQKVSNNLTAATLYYSVRTMLVQPTALLPTATEFGYGSTTKGLMRTIKRSEKDPIHLSNELSPRVFDVFLNDVALAFGGTKIQKAKIKAKDWGIAGMKALDYVAAEATWRTAFSTAKGKGMKQREAATFADEAVVRTQGSGARGDLSPVQMSALGKAVTLWQTFTINNANFLAKNVLGIKNPELKPKESAGRVMRYVLGSAMISTLFEDGLGIQSPQPAPIKEIVKGLERGDSEAAIALKTMMELAEIVPVGSSLKFGSHPAGPVLGYFGDLTEVLSGNDPFHKDLLPKALEGDKRSMIKIAELIGKGVGVPGTGQAVKFARGRERGESVPGAILGRYQPGRGKGGRSSRRRSRRSRRSSR